MIIKTMSTNRRKKKIACIDEDAEKCLAVSQKVKQSHHMIF